MQSTNATLFDAGPHTHTHLLRNIIANFVVECVTRAQNNPYKADRKDWLTQRELQCEVCFLRPCSKEGSDAAEPFILDRK